MPIIEYPEVYYSDKLEEILSSRPPLPNPPVAPVAPQKPANPGEYDSGGNRGCAIFMIIAAIVVFFVVVGSDMDNKAGVILPLLLLLPLSWFMLKTTTWDKESHEAKKKQYADDLRNYPSAVAQYQSECANYQQKKEEYDRCVSQLQSPESILRHRKSLFYQWERSRMVPQFFDCEEEEIIKKGVAEDFFYSQLVRQGLVAFQNKKVQVGRKYYYPDILIKDGNVIVDIEIDEPYAGNDGTPIHYADEHYGLYTSSDEDRNRYFCKQGFEVIRFAEEQIFLHTDTCISFIIQFLDDIKSGIQPRIPNDISVDKWTKDVASRWAYQRFRNTYVPSDLQRSISEERHRSYEEIRDSYTPANPSPIVNHRQYDDVSDDLPF